MVDVTEKKLSRAEAAAFCKARGFPVQRSTLDKYATYGGGPKYTKWGNKPNGRALYAPADLLEWLKTQQSAPQDSTSQAA